VKFRIFQGPDCGFSLTLFTAILKLAKQFGHVDSGKSTTTHPTRPTPGCYDETASVEFKLYSKHKHT